MGSGAVEIITAAIYGNGSMNEFGEKAAVWNRVLGLPVEDLDTVIGGLVEGRCAT